MAQVAVIVEVFIAERQGEDALADEGGDAVLDQVRLPPVVEAGGKTLDEPDRPIARPEQ